MSFKSEKYPSHEIYTQITEKQKLETINPFINNINFPILSGDMVFNHNLTLNFRLNLCLLK